MKKNWIDYFYALMNPTVIQKAHDFDDFGKNDFFRQQHVLSQHTPSQCSFKLAEMSQQ
jgi:hypothetical protein